MIDRFVLSMILANVTSAMVSIPGHIYHMIQQQERSASRAEAVKANHVHWWSFQVIINYNHGPHLYAFLGFIG